MKTGRPSRQAAGGVLQALLYAPGDDVDQLADGVEGYGPGRISLLVA